MPSVILEYNTKDLTTAGKTVMLSFILYMVDPFSLFFTVPIHFHGLNNGKREVILFSGVGITLAVALRELIRYRGVDLDGAVLVFFVIGFGFPVMLSLMSTAFYLITQIRVMGRVAVVYLASTLTGILMVAFFQRSGDMMQETLTLFAQSLDALGLTAGSGVLFSSRQLAEAAVYTFTRVFAAMLIVQFGIGYGLAWEYLKRKKGLTVSLLDRISVPDWFIWVLLGSWTVILLDIVLGLGMLGIIGWNLGLPAGLIYVLRGMALFRRISAKRRRVPFSGFQIAIILMLVMFIPGVNILSLVALGILGVSEIWIVYRNE